VKKREGISVYIEQIREDLIEYTIRPIIGKYILGNFFDIFVRPLIFQIIYKWN